MAGVKLGIRNTSIYEEGLIKLWGRHCISNPIIEPFLEIISFKNFPGISMPSGSSCLIQISDLMDLWCWLSKDFHSNIMSSQIKQVVSKKIPNIHFYFFFHHSYRVLKCYSKSQSLTQEPNQDIIHQRKPGIIDSVHSGDGMRLPCRLILPLETQGLIPSTPNSPPPDALSHHVYSLTRLSNISSVLPSHSVLVLI